MALIKCPECKKKISDQCENCPNCGYPIKAKITANETEASNKADLSKDIAIKPFLKKWWFWTAVGVVLAAFVLGTVLFINRDTKPRLDKDGNPIFIEFTNEVYTNANKYKGYHINIKGKVFQVMGDNGTSKGIQVWLDPETCEQNLMICYNTDVDVKQGDYISCSGYIDSVTKYKNAYDAELHVPLIYINAYECATPNALRDHMKSNGYTDTQINYAMNSGELDWTSDIKDIIWSYNFEAEEITVTNCIRCNRKFYGEYNSCQYLNCGGGVKWFYYHGYSRADTISKLLDLGFSNEDVDATMKDYEYGEFIDEKDLSDCIKVTGKLCEHFWNPATCQELSSCPYCGETKGGYADHEYSNRKCIWCEKEEPWTPPSISCSNWVSLKELQEKAGYYITTPENTITIEDLNDARVSFVLSGFPGAWQNGDAFDLSYNGITVHCKTDSDSNYVYEMIKLQYSDLVAIGVLS